MAAVAAAATPAVKMERLFESIFSLLPARRSYATWRLSGQFLCGLEPQSIGQRLAEGVAGVGKASRHHFGERAQRIRINLRLGRVPSSGIERHLVEIAQRVACSAGNLHDGGDQLR